MILADTDVLIDYLAGVSPIREQIARYAAADQLATTAVNAFELLSGADKTRRGDAVRQLAEALPVVALDQAAAEKAAEVHRQLAQAGQPIGMGDSLIAGIALACDCPLFTRNRQHFERVSGLELVEIERG